MAGYQHVHALTDSTQALSAIYREQPDLLLLDLMMPDVSGIDILEAFAIRRGDEAPAGSRANWNRIDRAASPRVDARCNRLAHQTCRPSTS